MYVTVIQPLLFWAFIKSGTALFLIKMIYFAIYYACLNVTLTLLVLIN